MPMLGTCCVCGEREATDAIMLPYKSPTPGKGWGNFLKKLPPDGAIAVVCEECFFGLGDNIGERLEFICVGFPQDNVRAPYKPDEMEAFGE